MEGSNIYTDGQINSLSRCDGVINVYKEAGVTSFHVVSRVKKLLGVRKAGHTGTLDPDARGVLPVCIGKATKLVELLMNTSKTYKAVLRFGRRTDTQDISGKTIDEISSERVIEILNNYPSEILCAFKHFSGEIEQIPPMYSALKVDGVKLVDAARRGENIERAARHQIIYGYENVEIARDLLSVSFEVECSKGTYIRTLCEDIGSYLGVPACMESLERIAASGLKKEDSVTLSRIESYVADGTIEKYILPIDYFLSDYPSVTIRDSAVKKILHGNILSLSDCKNNIVPADGEIYRMYDDSGMFYALYRFLRKENVLRSEKMFV